MSRLGAEGHSRHFVRLAVGRGLLVSVRRDWVAVPGADSELVQAARCGVALTCITQARRLGLWVLEEDGAHVGAATHARAPNGPAVVHWAQPVRPRHPDDLVDPIDNVLALVAACQPFEAALATWESALRIGLISRERLASLPLGPAGLRLLAEASPFSDSGLESIFRIRLRWLNVRILAQTWIAGHHVDFLIGERLIVQIDGGHHVGAQRERDNAHDGALRLLGYSVIRVGYRQVLEDWPAVQDAVMAAITQGLHLVHTDDARRPGNHGAHCR